MAIWLPKKLKWETFDHICDQQFRIIDFWALILFRFQYSNPSEVPILTKDPQNCIYYNSMIIGSQIKLRHDVLFTQLGRNGVKDCKFGKKLPISQLNLVLNLVLFFWDHNSECNAIINFYEILLKPYYLVKFYRV